MKEDVKPDGVLMTDARFNANPVSVSSCCRELGMAGQSVRFSTSNSATLLEIRHIPAQKQSHRVASLWMDSKIHREKSDARLEWLHVAALRHA